VPRAWESTTYVPHSIFPCIYTNTIQFWVNIASFYNTFVTGIAFTGAGWKYYFLFVFWDAFEFVFIYFFFVETKNRTLEELTDLLVQEAGSEVPGET